MGGVDQQSQHGVGW